MSKKACTAGLATLSVVVLASTLISASPAEANVYAQPSAVVVQGKSTGSNTDFAPAPASGVLQTADSHEAVRPAYVPPLSASTDALRLSAAELESGGGQAQSPTTSKNNGAAGAPAAVAGCDIADFASKSGSALVQQVKSSTTTCVNTLFGASGSNAAAIFSEAQMTDVAYAFRDVATYYPGNNTTSAAQLVSFLRAGYYVQYYDAATVGNYGQRLKTAIQSALDRFFSNPRSQDVSDANGQTLSEAVTLIDSSVENARYLYVVKRLLTGYNSQYDASWSMLNAVNNSYTVLFRGHQDPAFVRAVIADPSILDTLYNFAATHLGLLGGSQSYLTSNAGRELGRFLQHAQLKSLVSARVSGLLQQSSMTGTTAALWIGLAEMTDSYDKANCSTYNTCDLGPRLKSAILTGNYTCSASIRILSQQMSSAELADSCASLKSQDAYFHSTVKDNGPVANDNNTSIEVVVFDSSADYQTYAGAMFGIDTNNGGMYLEGDPSVVGNQPRFIAYEAEWVRPAFQVWNLNHEYTHYLDGRFNMYGDFGSNVATPTIWWIEGFAEYISYSYRNEAYTAAYTEAAKQTYSLSTLFNTTYSNDTTRVYRWGYLATRFMLTNHWSDMNTVLGYYRTGNWAAARTFLTSTIGTKYDAEFRTFLTKCAAGDCGGSTDPNPPANQAPVSSFTVTTNELQASFVDTSTDADGTIVSRSWSFGDGSSSTAASPTKTYASAGTYDVSLKVTDNKGATNTATQRVVVKKGGGSPTDLPECTDGDVRALAGNCQRSNRSGQAGDNDFLFIYIPENTAKMTITTSGGSGNVDLYYNNASWATPNSYTSSSVTSGNAETLTITNPLPGYHYITLHGASDFSGVKVSTRF